MDHIGYTKVKKCRVSNSPHLISVLDLGYQELTGVFPPDRDTALVSGPLELAWCPVSGLLQLSHSYDPSNMYGDNYGYRSGLNQSMVCHLTSKIHSLERFTELKSGDTVLDIGSNDGTSLRAYATAGLSRIGVDPTGNKFKEFYPSEITLIPEFFSAKGFKSITNKRAKVVSSIAMFYDLEDPVSFARQVCEILRDDGYWHFEQSYMPSMLRTCSYDTVCHEHIEYYSLKVVKYILEQADMKIVDVQMNAVNGGSFAVTAAKKKLTVKANSAVVDWLLEQEDRMGLDSPKPFRDFEERVYRHRADLSRLLHMLKDHGKLVLGYGASTKGNVMLQFCGITEKELPAIAEVNSNKFGHYTPGTRIPIVSESEAKALRPDYFLVLPWHFKNNILEREREFLNAGGKMIFPLPEIEII